MNTTTITHRQIQTPYSQIRVYGLLLTILLLCNSLAAQTAAQAEKATAEPRWQIATSDNLMPHFEPVHGRKVLYVDGTPFTVLAVEIPWWNLIAGKYAETQTAYDYLYPAAEKMGLNALKVPIKWSMIEPQKDLYDFSYLDHVKEMAEKHHLKLVLNWFGHYASADGNIYGNLTGNMYAPWYVINDEKTYPRAIDADGLAHHNAASYEYDAIIQRETAAFRAFMQHLKNVDSQRHTVVMVQVENEIAVFGVDRQNRKLWRDHSPVSNQLFAEKKFTDDLKYSAWRLSSNWIRRLTDAGAEVYPLPFFHNFVGGRVAEWMVGGAPGEDVATSLDNCPNISFVGVNAYFCAQWRQDNSCAKPSEATIEELREPLLRYHVSRNLPAITETNSGANPIASRLAYLAVAEFGAPIFAPWALTASYPESYEPYVLKDGSLANGAFALRDAYNSLRKALPPIAYYATTNQVKVFMAPSPGQRFSEKERVNGLDLTVTGVNNGQAIIIHPREREFLVVGYRCTLTVHDAAFVWPGVKNVRVERGQWTANGWNTEGEAAYGFDQSNKTLDIELDEVQAVRVSW
jgi:hypothetical protein